MDRRKVIASLRAKAESTTFPEEADAFRRRADKLEAKYFPTVDPPRFGERAASGMFGEPWKADRGGIRFNTTHPQPGRVREQDAAWAHVDGIIFDGGPNVTSNGTVQPNGDTVFRTRSGMRVTFKPGPGSPVDGTA